MYDDWSKKVYPEDGTGNNVNNKWYCCGYMANGRKQCDKLKKWKFVNGNSFTLCDNSYEVAYAETRQWNGNTYSKPRRDLCCENDHFQDCTSCKSFVVWEFGTSYICSSLFNAKLLLLHLLLEKFLRNSPIKSVQIVKLHNFCFGGF